MPLNLDLFRQALDPGDPPELKDISQTSSKLKSSKITGMSLRGQRTNSWKGQPGESWNVETTWAPSSEYLDQMRAWHEWQARDKALREMFSQ